MGTSRWNTAGATSSSTISATVDTTMGTDTDVFLESTSYSPSGKQCGGRNAAVKL